MVLKLEHSHDVPFEAVVQAHEYKRVMAYINQYGDISLMIDESFVICLI